MVEVGQGRVVLVTGGSGNLGASIARACAGSGFSVAIHYRSNRQAADAVVESIVRADGRAAAFGADLGAGAQATGSDTGQSLVDEVVRVFGRIDAVVNNGADQTPIAFDELTNEDWLRTLEANFMAATRVTRAALDVMAPGGSVVNVSSVEASSAFPHHAHYAASKAALESFTRSLALELGPRQLRANCVAPGLIAREGLERDWPQGLAWWSESAPNARPVSADEVAAVVSFLLGPRSSGINGAVIPVDGGWSASARTSF